MAAATSGRSIPDIEEQHRRTRVTNLTKLIDVELDLLMESFLEAKRRIDPMIAQINQARDKFEDILQQRGGGGEMMMELDMERELQDMKQRTSKLKSKIPFNLITPEYQPAADPNVIFQPQTHTCKPTTSNLSVVVDDDDALLGPKSENVNLFIDRLNNDRYAPELSILPCFLAFPEGAFLKASLLYSYAIFSLFTTSGSVVSTVCDLVSKGFINCVYKKHSSTTLDGFWMDPFFHQTLKARLSREMQRSCLVHSSSIDGEDIIYSGSADIPSDLQFLHLGKWQRFPTHHHIEMPNPNLYFKYAGDMQNLIYISFRGVSVMKELPSNITQLRDPNKSAVPIEWRCLSILDLKACHHLEVLPSDIGTLWHSLKHLDMSECYFLDHMPASLSRLTRLRVLKGFFVGETNHNEESCTLQDLSSMEYLVKLHIYTSLKTFPSDNHLKILARFRYLRNLTICWGGCPTRDENPQLRKSPANRLKRFVTRGPDYPPVNKQFSFSLEKLDLRGAPEMGTRDWFKPSNFEKLEKLYIRGGQLTDLRLKKEPQKDKQLAAAKVRGWSVKILRLRHLSKLEMDWSEVHDSFPNVVSLEMLECPNLTSFPCDDNGLWMKDTTESGAPTCFGETNATLMNLYF